MVPRSLDCPHCGGPLAPRAVRVTVTCKYCGHAVSLDGAIVEAAAFRAARDRCRRPSGPDPHVVLAGATFAVRAHLATGASSEVFWGERIGGCGERVLIKLLRAPDDRDLVRREWATLAALRTSSARGTATFVRRIPEPIGFGDALTSERPVVVMRFKSGFVHTLDDVMRAYPAGVDARHGAWIWRRLLEVLGWAHEANVVHGAVLPEHVVLHARDHGALLVGWSAAGHPGEPPRLFLEARRPFYPEQLTRSSGELSCAADLVMAARNIRFLAGERFDAWPAPVVDLLEACAEPSTLGGADARALHAEVGRAARQAFGPPAFVPFHMPGWREAKHPH